ncbi:PBP1A family penicillin-binding protein [soil metagenome]
MAHGRISRAHQRQAAAKRRLARYGQTRFGQRGHKLPPNLLRESTGRTKKSGLITIPRMAMLASAVSLIATGIFIVFTVITSVLGVTGTMAAYRNVNEDLPNAADIAVETFQTTKLYDRDGELLQEVDNPNYGWRTYVSLDDVSPWLIDATVAAEDATYWNNYGVEPVGIVRAAYINVSGTGSSGASTITQQLVRSIYPDEIGFDVSYTRKAREALAAVALAQQYSKTDIMTMYLNQIYYGNRSYGIEAASQTMFNKHAADLNLAEASFLAGLPQQPSTFADNFGAAKTRQQYVLQQMIEYRYITQAEGVAAWNEPLQPNEDRSGMVQNAPHFTQYVKDYILDNYGEEALYGGLHITTSIDLDLQQVSEQVVAAGVADMEAFQRNNGAMVVMVPWSGEVLAMVGSADFNDALINGQVNYATSLIQPGSSIKPIVYAAAFSEGWNPATLVMDVPSVWDSPGQPEPYEPQNYTRTFYGAVSVRTSLANSLNIPAVKATEFAGLTSVMDTADAMGYDRSLPEDPDFYGLALGLGAGEVELLEHTNAYATLANNGTFVPPHPILKIADSQGNVLFELDPEEVEAASEQALAPGHAYQVTSILADDEARELIFGPDNIFGATSQQLGRPVAAKSGTTENWRDLWTMGYTSDISIGVWVGRSGDSNPSASLPELDGSQAAGPIWQEMMNVVHDRPEFAALLVGPDDQPMPDDFAQPDDVYRGEVCSATGNRATSGGTTTAWLVRGDGPDNACGDLTDYQREELEKAIDSLGERDARFASGAINSVREYADAAGVRGVRAPAGNDDDRPGDRDSGDDEDDDDEEQIIEPLN